jgi:hypothetical protein
MQSTQSRRGFLATLFSVGAAGLIGSETASALKRSRRRGLISARLDAREKVQHRSDDHSSYKTRRDLYLRGS